MTMKIRDRVIDQRKVSVAELAANPANWRPHDERQRAVFRALLAEIGFAGSALAYYSERANGALTLIDGHMRRDEVGLDFFMACDITDLTDDEADKLIATYDPVSEMAGADAAKLDALLQDVEIGSEQLADMLAALAEENGIVEGEVELPTITATTRHTVVVPYTDDDVPTLCRWLGCEKLPATGLGKKINERIKADSAQADR